MEGRKTEDGFHRREGVLWGRESQRCAGARWVSEVAIKSHMQFGSFIRQRGAMVLTLSPLQRQPSAPYHGATMAIKKINHSNIS